MIKLTPREKDILDIIAKRGLTNKMIARQLHLSESSIKIHISNMLKKYGAKNRVQLTIFAKDQIH